VRTYQMLLHTLNTMHLPKLAPRREHHSFSYLPLKCATTPIIKTNVRSLGQTIYGADCETGCTVNSLAFPYASSSLPLNSATTHTLRRGELAVGRDKVSLSQNAPANRPAFAPLTVCLEIALTDLSLKPVRTLSLSMWGFGY